MTLDEPTLKFVAEVMTKKGEVVNNLMLMSSQHREIKLKDILQTLLARRDDLQKEYNDVSDRMQVLEMKLFHTNQSIEDVHHLIEMEENDQKIRTGEEE
jgi:hypothetical protein